MSTGLDCTFVACHKHSDIEIRSFENAHGLTLPEDYRRFLRDIGAGSYFINKYGLGYEFRALQNIAEHSSKVFAGGQNPFPTLLLTVSLTGRGDEGGFNLTRMADDKFAVFSHEEDPDEWSSNADAWTTFGSWLANLVESHGENDLPQPR
jgi:hypothetical protein